MEQHFAKIMPKVTQPDVHRPGSIPEPGSLDELNSLIAASRPLVAGSTRAVLGEGPIGALVAFVGEQPGDQEDLQGRPFVGPAGQMLDRALAEAGLDRGRVYVTNAVKHFKFTERGKRRIHQTPTAGEVKHYRWWLDQELRLVHPNLVVALGGTAVLALARKALPINRVRGAADLAGRRGYITVYPSYLLRLLGSGLAAPSLPRLRRGSEGDPQTGRGSNSNGGRLTNGALP